MTTNAHDHPTPPEVILAAHGWGDDSAANALVTRIAAELAARIGGPVHPAFNMGDPGFADAARRWPRAVTLPLMTSDAFFVRTRLAKIIGQTTAEPGGGTVPLVTPPVGVDPAARSSFAASVLASIADAPQPGLVLVIGHGTRRHAASGATTFALADQIRALAPRWRVEAAFLDQDPTIESMAALTRGPGRPLVVAPWLIGGGGHELEDIRTRLNLPETLPTGAWTTPPGLGPVVITPTLGAGDAIVDGLEDLLHRAAERGPLRLGARPSTLARWQAEHAAARLAAFSVPTEIVEIVTRGDRDRTTPIEGLGAGVFTDELETALFRGEIDVAVHSLKDLPHRGGESGRRVIAAVLPRGSVEETLVSRTGVRLADLPSGARVGTSSRRRSRQVLALRPDLDIRPIRGPVDARVAQVMNGDFDAAILARAGLERIDLDGVVAEQFPLDDLAPEAGQGAIVLQTRPDDWYAHSLAARADDVAAARAVETERRFAALVEGGGDELAAAHAVVDKDGRVTLHARIIPHDSTLPFRSGVFHGEDGAALATRAALQLTSSGAATTSPERALA